MENEEIVMKMYVSSVEGSSRKGRPLRGLKDRMKKYLSERRARRNGLEQARMKGMHRERWRSCCCHRQSF